MHRRVGCASLVVGTALAGIWAFFATGWDFLLPNLGLPFGTYRELNALLNSVRREPGVRLTSHHALQDIGIEDMYIWTTLDDRVAVFVSVPQNTDHRTIDQVVITKHNTPLQPGVWPEWDTAGFRVMLDRYPGVSSAKTMTVAGIVRDAEAIYEYASDVNTPESAETHRSVVYVVLSPVR